MSQVISNQDAGTVRGDDGPSGTVEVAVLGPLMVHRADGTAVGAREWTTSKTRQLLRVLALAEGEPVRCAALVDTLWPNADEAHGRGSLRTAASQVRRVLGANCVVRVGDSLRLEGVVLDTTEFCVLARRSQRAAALGDDLAAVALATDALALYRGEIEEFDDTDTALACERYRLLRDRLRLDVATAALRLARPDLAVDFVLPLAVADPGRERACRLLMRAYAALGERAMALRAYERCRRSLGDELGVDPSAETQQLFVRLLHDEGQDMPELVSQAS